MPSFSYASRRWWEMKFQNIDLWPPFRGAITPLHITLVLIRCQELFIGDVRGPISSAAPLGLTIGRWALKGTRSSAA
jgi:hypothetical protein